MENMISRKMVNLNDLFDDDFLDAKKLYLHCFNALPSEFYVGQIDAEKAFTAFREKFTGKIIRTYHYQWYDKKKKEACFSRTIALLENDCVIEFTGTYCELWHNGKQPDFLTTVAELVSPFRQRQRREPLEVNLVIRGRNKLELKAMEIKRTRLDLDLYYNHDFGAIDELIRNRLNKKKDKGIILLHGLPGTGKTTYLRYLISRIKKRILFLSPSIAGDLMNPEFIELLTSNPDTVVIIEDAENIIMDRKLNPGPSVSNLLNISDGLLADFLNVQLVCTFNSPLTLVDSALMRKGRLIAKYEFGMLDITRSQRLSDHLGFKTTITRPMTVAEIANQYERQHEIERPAAIGFRRYELIN